MIDRPVGKNHEFRGVTSGGYTFVAKLTQYDKFVVELQMFDPQGRAFMKPHQDSEGSYETLDDAKKRAEAIARQLTPNA